MNLEREEWMYLQEAHNQAEQNREQVRREVGSLLEQLQTGHSVAQQYAQQAADSIAQKMMEMQFHAAQARRAHSEEVKRKEAEAMNRVRQEEANIRRQLENDRLVRKKTEEENARLRAASRAAHEAEMSRRKAEINSRQATIAKEQALEPRRARNLSTETNFYPRDRSRSERREEEWKEPVFKPVRRRKTKDPQLHNQKYHQHPNKSTQWYYRMAI
jgi:hypothetical protein